MREESNDMLQLQLQHVERSLAEEFAGVLTQQAVHDAVELQVERHADARITQFIPVFVHRSSRAYLRSMAGPPRPPHATPLISS